MVLAHTLRRLLAQRIKIRSWALAQRIKIRAWAPAQLIKIRALAAQLIKIRALAAQFIKIRALVITSLTDESPILLTIRTRQDTNIR
jgi:hypothetical protein